MEKKLNLKKIIKRSALAVLGLLAVLTVPTINAQGYMYSSDGMIIESSAGYTDDAEEICPYIQAKLDDYNTLNGTDFTLDDRHLCIGNIYHIQCDSFFPFFICLRNQKFTNKWKL